MALPTFHGAHKPHSSSSSSTNGPAIANGHLHSLVILENGTVKAFGRSNYGQLGQGNTATIGDNANEMGDNLAPVDLGSGRTAIAVASGIYHSVAILDNGTVKAWGYNSYGQLGQGSSANIGDGANEMGDNLAAIDLGSGRTATAIAAGFYHTVALLDNGTVKAWGQNNYGQLGQGNTTNIGDNANEMGDNLAPVDLGSGRTATAIAAGLYSTAAVLDDGTVKIWGFNSHGQLGQGNTVTIGDGANEMGDNLTAVDLGSGRTATDVSIGYINSMALLDNGTVKVWGQGAVGYNGQGANTNNLGDGANEMGDNLTAVDLGTGRTAVKIFAGYRHCAALLDNGTVKAWGYNYYGQLGQGNRITIGDNANEMGDNLPAIDLGSGRTATDITVGTYLMSAVLDDGTVKSWGYNSYGQLGQGNTNHIGDGANEMGDNLSSIDLSSSSDKVLQ